MNTLILLLSFAYFFSPSPAHAGKIRHDFCAKASGVVGCETGEFDRKRFNRCTKQSSREDCPSINDNHKVKNKKRLYQYPSKARLSTRCEEQVKKFNEEYRESEVNSIIINCMDLLESREYATLMSLARKSDSIPQNNRASLNAFKNCVEAKMSCSDTIPFQGAYTHMNHCEETNRTTIHSFKKALAYELNRLCQERDLPENEVEPGFFRKLIDNVYR